MKQTHIPLARRRFLKKSTGALGTLFGIGIIGQHARAAQTGWRPDQTACDQKLAFVLSTLSSVGRAVYTETFEDIRSEAEDPWQNWSCHHAIQIFSQTVPLTPTQHDELILACCEDLS
jgi:hypothetical protein